MLTDRKFYEDTELISVVAASLLALGLTACCCEDDEPASEPTAADETAPVEEVEDVSSNQKLEAACLAMSGSMLEANAAMLDSMQGAISDPQTAVDVSTDLVNGFGKIAEEAQNAEAKEKATAAHADIVALRSAMQKIFVDEDLGAMGRHTTALDNFEKSYTALMEICE